jgi:phosphohistidine phosphatase
MKTLLLLRHSEAETESPFFKDYDRELTPNGIQLAAIFGQKLAEQTFKPDFLLTSSAVRAYTTAKVVAEKIGFEVEKIDSRDKLYNASPRLLLEALHELPTTAKTVVLVNHNMSISFFAEMLTGTNLLLSPCGAVCLSFDTNDWATINGKAAKILWQERC